MLAMKEIEKVKNNGQIGVVATNSNVFNKKKNELKEFSEKLPKEAELPCVPTSGGLFGWFDYDVTGSDLNRLTKRIQDKMIEQNKALRRTIQEFNTIYDTFSALDKEYIQGILLSLKAAEEANSKALKGIEGVQENQNEIKQIIHQQKQVIQVLKKFKEQIEQIEHLADVDKIFAVFSVMQSNVKEIEEKVEAQELGVANLTDKMKELLFLHSAFQNTLNQLEEYQTKKYQTLKQLISNQNESISKIETISQENKANIKKLNEEVTAHGEKIVGLKRVIKDESQALYEKVARNNSEIDTKLDLINNEVAKNKVTSENDIKEIRAKFEQQEESISAYLEAELSRANNEIKELHLLIGNLSKVLQTTKIISFGSILVSILVVLIIKGAL